MVTQIIKRDGRKLPFNIEKIANAVYKAAQAVGGSDYNEAMDIANKVCIMIEDVYYLLYNANCSSDIKLTRI